MTSSKSSGPATESVLLGQQCVPGELTLPNPARGVVVFTHYAESRRQVARNHHLAELFHSKGLGTLLFNLQESEQAIKQDPVFTIQVQSGRVRDALQWLQGRTDAKSLPVGIFASGTGTAAAFIAAAGMPRLVQAIVSRSGRPDKAEAYLAGVRAPTLLIVGAKDPYVLKVNRACQQAMTCVTVLQVVPRATHLFDELGTLQAVATLAGDWFLKYFGSHGDVSVDEILLRR